MSSRQDPDDSRIVGIAVQIITLGTLILPVLGAIVRYVAYLNTNGVSPPDRLAVSEGIPELAVDGLRVVYVAAVALPAAFFLRWIRDPRPGKLQARAIAIVIVIIVTIVAFPSFPVSAEASITLVSLYLVAEVAATSHISSRRIWLPALVILAFIAVMTGLTYQGEPAETYTFSTSSPPPGLYARLGEGDGFTYLLPCSGPRRTIGVPTADILGTVSLPQTRVDFLYSFEQPSLLAIVFAGAHMPVGLNPGCP